MHDTSDRLPETRPKILCSSEGGRMTYWLVEGTFNVERVREGDHATALIDRLNACGPIRR